MDQLRKRKETLPQFYINAYSAAGGGVVVAASNGQLIIFYIYWFITSYLKINLFIYANL